MASVATERIKREFMEVAKSEEVLNCISVLTSLCVGDLFDEKIGIADVNIRRNRFQIWSSRCRNFVAKCDIKVELINYNYTELCGEISGPPDTPYEGGNFVLEIKIPETYPFNPPKKVQLLMISRSCERMYFVDKNRDTLFVTKIWHPNISSVTGAICLDILKDQWAAAMTLRTVLLSLQALLSAAVPDDPQDAIAARQFKENPDMFWLTAKHWSHTFAGASNSFPESDVKIKRLVDIGVDERNMADLSPFTREERIVT